jgi:hypothetical protein
MARGISFSKRLAQRIQAFSARRPVQKLDADVALERACRMFGLNPDRSSDRRKLLKELAFVCFPPPKRGGRPRKWTGEQLCRLLSDVDQTRSQYRCSKKKACELIVKESLFQDRYKGQNPATLRRKLQDATDPERNAMLDTMVTNRLPRERGPRVIAKRRPFKFWSRTAQLAYLRDQRRARQARQKVVKKCIALISSSWRMRALAAH